MVSIGFTDRATASNRGLRIRHRAVTYAAWKNYEEPLQQSCLGNSPFHWLNADDGVTFVHTFMLNHFWTIFRPLRRAGEFGYRRVWFQRSLVPYNIVVHPCCWGLFARLYFSYLLALFNAIRSRGFIDMYRFVLTIIHIYIYSFRTHFRIFFGIYL